MGVIAVEEESNPDVKKITRIIADNPYDYGSQKTLFEEKPDPFLQKPENIRKFNGLSSEFKRKITRLSKAAIPIPDSDSAGDAKSKAVDVVASYNTGYSIFDVTLPPYNLDYLAQLYEISAPNFAAVNAKAANIVGLGYGWEITGQAQDILEAAAGNEDKLSKVQKKIETVKRAMSDWLDNTNVDETMLEVLLKTVIDWEATGNGYIEVGRKTTGEIGYIGHIPSVTMRVRTTKDGFVQIVGKYATFFRNFGDKDTPDPLGKDPQPNEIIHFKKYTPTNSYYGIPDVVAAKNALAGLEYADRFNLDYFEYKAVPRYVITVQGATLSSSAEQKLIQFFRTGLKGKNHRTLYIPLPAGDDVKFSMEPVEAGVQDASYTNYRKLNIDSILMAHRVPITKVSISDAGASVAIAADADKTFKEQVCGPSQNIFEKKFNKIISEKTDIVLLKLNELALTDAMSQSQIDQRYLQTQVLLPNEIRQRMGLAGIPGGNTPVQLKPQQAADQVSQITDGRQREKDRMDTQPDKLGTGRNPKGEGRQVA